MFGMYIQGNCDFPSPFKVFILSGCSEHYGLSKVLSVNNDSFTASFPNQMLIDYFLREAFTTTLFQSVISDHLTMHCFLEKIFWEYAFLKALS